MFIIGKRYSGDRVSAVLDSTKPPSLGVLIRRFGAVRFGALLLLITVTDFRFLFDEDDRAEQASVVFLLRHSLDEFGEPRCHGTSKFKRSVFVFVASYIYVPYKNSVL
eukprot:scaffold134800_cov36-Cyclotella_meneghiniana.AAC.1